MISEPLPAELVSLIHHVELNKAGWWEKGIQRLILATIWLYGKKLALDAIVESLHRDFQVVLSKDRIRNHLNSLRSSGELVLLPSGEYKISEAAINSFEREIKEAEGIERQTKAQFDSLVGQYCPTLDPADTWIKFNDLFLIPLIRGIGANTYRILAGASINLDPARLEDFLGAYHTDLHAGLRLIVTSFMDPKSPFIRSYILRCLNAYFFIEASSLDERTIEKLSRFTTAKPSFLIFVDTNVLFSILGLHENPSNEAALLLMHLTKQLAKEVEVKFYVLPPTLEETKRVLISIESYLSGLRLTPNLAEAAISTGLSGIVERFFQEARKGNTSFGAKNFFEPYIRDLLAIVRSKGLELFNEKLDQYGTDQEVVDDLMDQLKFEKRFLQRSKTYEQLEHDVILWHFARRKRPVQVESPVEARYWIVTIDYRFIGFDGFKRRNLPEFAMPICIHPTTLIQILQFWIPRTREFEEAILSSIRLPFLFQEFDRDSEQLTIRILEALGRFENVGDLSKETTASILVNTALRQKMAAEPDVQKQVDLVREALIDEYEKTQKKLRETVERAQRLESAVQNREHEIRVLSEEINLHKQRLGETKRALELEQAGRQSLEERLRKLEDHRAVTREEKEARRAIRRFLLTGVLFPGFLVLSLGLSIIWILSPFVVIGIWSIAFGVLSAMLMLWFLIIDQRGVKEPIISNWQPFVFLHRFKVWAFGTLWTVLMGAISSAFYELIRTTKILP